MEADQSPEEESNQAAEPFADTASSELPASGSAQPGPANLHGQSAPPEGVEAPDPLQPR